MLERHVIAAGLGLAMLASGCQIVIPPRDKATIAKVEQVEAREAELERAAQWLIGSFSTRDQAAFGREYPDVRLNTARVWSRRKDGVWIVMEWAPPSDLQHPFRQRIVRARLQENGLLVCDLFSFPGQPVRYAEAWKTESRLGDLTPRDLGFLEGCQWVLKRAGDIVYEGGTVGEGCANTQRGATYETSEVRISPDAIMIWDRGFDKSGKQVWGATSGPTQYLRTGG